MMNALNTLRERNLAPGKVVTDDLESIDSADYYKNLQSV